MLHLTCLPSTQLRRSCQYYKYRLGIHYSQVLGGCQRLDCGEHDHFNFANYRESLASCFYSLYARTCSLMAHVCRYIQYQTRGVSKLSSSRPTRSPYTGALLLIAESGAVWTVCQVCYSVNFFQPSLIRAPDFESSPGSNPQQRRLDSPRLTGSSRGEP